MSPQEKAAIISGLFAFFGGLVTFFVTKLYEQRHLLAISSDRKKSLVGRWKGKVCQPNISEYDIELTLSVTKHKVSGEARLEHLEGEATRIVKLSLDGGFLYEKFLKLDYKNTDSSNIQFGSITLEVSSNSKRMQGKFSGYGSTTESVVGGDMSLEKMYSS